MEIIRERKLVTVEEYALEFEWRECPGSGFSFPCDRDGNILKYEIYSICLDHLKNARMGNIM